MSPNQQRELDRMTADLSSLLGPRDIPGNWTDRQRDEYDHRRAYLESNVRYAREVQGALARVLSKIDETTTPLAIYRTIWNTLAAEQSAAKVNAKDRGQLRNLELSLRILTHGRRAADDTGWTLETLRVGQLLREAGFVEVAPIENQVNGQLPFFGPISVLAQRLKVLEAERDDCLARLVNVLGPDEIEQARIETAQAEARAAAKASLEASLAEAAEQKNSPSDLGSSSPPAATGDEEPEQSRSEPAKHYQMDCEPGAFIVGP